MTRLSTRAKMLVWMHIGGSVWAYKMSWNHGCGFTGALNLRSPTGGAAYGIPLKALMVFPDIDGKYCPMIRPSLIRTFKLSDVNEWHKLLKESSKNIAVKHFITFFFEIPATTEPAKAHTLLYRKE